MEGRSRGRSRGRRRIRRAGLSGVAALLWLACIAGWAVAAGPPFPAPVEGRRVYDEAQLWRADTIASAEATVRRWADRTGSQGVVYSQIVSDATTLEEAKGQAAALGNAWQVGRAGFDDGVVILFDIFPSRLHGHVVIVGGDGFRVAYLSDADSTSIFDADIKPWLVETPPDFDSALLAGLRAVDTRVTPENASKLQVARVANAALGLVVAPVVVLGLIAWPFFHWLRFGRDPHFLDDPSILMPAPPAGLTAAAGAVVFDGQSSRRALTTAMLDLASRGKLAFVDKSELLKKKVAVVVDPPQPTDEIVAAHQRLADRRPLSEAEDYALEQLEANADNGVVEGTDLLAFGKDASTFDEKVEAYAVAQGWFAQAPGKVRRRWWAFAIVELIGAGVAFWIATQIPMSGLTIVSVGLAVAGLATLALGYVMPARTLPGATIRAMLAAYRRTLQATMAQARSLPEVVSRANLAWIQTPDQALVWGTALGLQHDVEDVLERSRADLESGRASPSSVWFPVWWSSGGSGAGFSSGSGGSGGGSMFSASAIPNIGGMMAALGTIGNAPSSSGGGGGGGGGFGGGGGGSF